MFSSHVFFSFTFALSAICVSPHATVFCSSLIKYFSVMLLRYFLNYFEMHSVAVIFTGITFVFTFHIRCIYVYIQGVPGGMCQTSGGCSLC